MKILIAGFTVAYLMLVWYQTNAWVEYCKLLGIKWFLKMREYLSYVNEYKTGIGKPGPEDYLEYLQEKHGEKFWVKLVLCPVCLSLWGAICSIPFLGWKRVFAVAFLANIFYYTIVLLKRKVEEEK